MFPYNPLMREELGITLAPEPKLTSSGPFSPTRVIPVFAPPKNASPGFFEFSLFSSPPKKFLIPLSRFPGSSANPCFASSNFSFIVPSIFPGISYQNLPILAIGPSLLKNH